jgi:hypothetical protein
MAEGTVGGRRELAGSGMADSIGSAPELWAEQTVGRGSSLYAPLTTVLRRPLDASAHVRLADAFGTMGAALSEAVELRFAATLDPRRTSERLRLAQILRAFELDKAAHSEFEIVAAATQDAHERETARHALAELRARPAEDEAESSLDEFRPGR